MTKTRALLGQNRKPALVSPVVLAAVLTFATLAPSAAAGAPAAFLTDVAGSVQIVRGGKTLPGKTGTALLAGDKVRVVSGRATVFSATAAPQSVTAGKQVSVGASGAASAPSAWKGVYNVVQGGFSRRVAKVPATMRPESLQALSPRNSKIRPGAPEFSWSFGKMDAASRASYEVFIRDDAGFAWRGITKQTKLAYPGGAPPLEPSRRYYWIVTPIGSNGEPDGGKASGESWFEFPGVNELIALEKDEAELRAFLKDSPAMLPLAQAALLKERGFYDEAVALLEPLAVKAGSARGEVLSTLFREVLTASGRYEQLTRWYPSQVQLKDSGAAAAIDLPAPETRTEKLPAQGVKTWHDPNGVYQIRLPSRWGAGVAQLTPSIQFTSFASMIDGKPDMSVAVAGTAELQGASLASQIFSICRQQGELTEEPAKAVTLDGRPAQRIDWKWNTQRLPMQGCSFEFSEGGKTFLISLSRAQNADAESIVLYETAVALLPPTFSTREVRPAPMAKLTYEEISAEIETTMKEMDAAISAQTGEKSAGRAEGPRTLAQAQAEFTAADAERGRAANGSLQRATAAANAARRATDIAWMMWDAGKREEAAQWFDRRDALQRESTESRYQYYDAAMAATARRINELSALTVDPSLQFAVSVAIDGWLNVQAARNAQMTNAARDAGDGEKQLQLALQELEQKRFALDNSFLAEEPRRLFMKRIAVAAAIESVADGQRSVAAYGQAEKSYRLALDWRQSVPDSYPQRDLGSPMRGLAYLYFSTGDSIQAREWYQKALAELDAGAARRRAQIEAEQDERLRTLMQVSDAQTYALIWNNLGNLASGSGDLRAAEEAYTKAITVMEPVEKDGFAGWTRASMQATSRGNIATLRADSGEIEEALKMADEVIAARRALDDDDGTAFWLLNRSGLLKSRGAAGDAEEARAGAGQALRLFQAARRLPLVVNASVFLAKLEGEAGNLAAAEAHAREALKVARTVGNAELVGSAARALARILSLQAKAATEPARKTELWKSFDALLAEAGRSDERLGAPLSAANTLYLRGLGREARSELVGALEDYKAAIARLETVRATARSQDAFADSEDSFRYYQAAVLLLVKMGRSDEAFDYLSRARSKKMRDTLRLSSIETNDKGLQTLLDLAGTLEKKLGTVRAQLQTEKSKPANEQDTARIVNLQDLAASTQAEFFRVSEQIKEANPNFEKVLTVKPRELKKAQRAIPPDTVLVQYAPLGEQLYIFIVTKDDLKIYTPRVKPEALWAAVREFRGAMDKVQADLKNGRPLRPVEEDAALKGSITNLYAMLIGPIEGEIAAKQNIAFIPTGMLYYLPIHALAKETPEGLRYLIQDKRVAYLAAADVLSVVQTRDESQFGAGLLALGDPAGANLPAAREEVQEIAKIYPASRALTGESATKQVLLEPANLNRRVLHLATHGVLDGANPESSYIQLAGNGDEGKLRVGEVYGLALNQVDLVTLSACQTALGQKNPDGSEITSLAEAFSSAGPPSVMASLWSVEDESTRQLMEKFYTGMANGRSKGESLQQAQVALLQNRETSHPFFWAPFEVLGDWR